MPGVIKLKKHHVYFAQDAVKCALRVQKTSSFLGIKCSLLPRTATFTIYKQRQTGRKMHSPRYMKPAATQRARA